MFKKLQELIRNNDEETWTDFYRTLEAEGCLDAEYLRHTSGQDITDAIKRVNSLSKEEVNSWLTWILRGERFCEGLFDACIEDGTLFKLLERGEMLCKE